MGQWGKRWERLPARRGAASPPSPRRAAGATPTQRVPYSDPLPSFLAAACRRASLPQPLVEYPFAKHLGRKFRADCCWVDAKLIVEVSGAVHRIAARFKADRERSQVIAILGFRLMLVSPQEVRNGRAVELVRAALAHPTDNAQGDSS